MGSHGEIIVVVCTQLQVGMAPQPVQARVGLWGYSAVHQAGSRLWLHEVAQPRSQLRAHLLVWAGAKKGKNIMEVRGWGNMLSAVPGFFV